MEAQPITLPRSAVALETRHGALDPFVTNKSQDLLGPSIGYAHYKGCRTVDSLTLEDLYVESSAFVSACGCSPVAQAGCTDSRYRVLLTVEGWLDPGRVYYVSGWLGEGLCGLAPEAVLTRREAIRLKKRGYL
ncbi:hypothetical protein LCGC14_0861980 [marine sediment metagenome]|uniref:Uncharacterized protein n=1 Tax=marine sediment metagenome TaxID=412755 RepID=A0A0F9P700_9ZZZZ